MNQVCVVFARSEQARSACQMLEQSLVGRSARHLSVYHRGGLLSSRLSRARAKAGAAFGALITGLVGAFMAFVALEAGWIDADPRFAVAVGAALGATYGLALGAIIGTTQPTRNVQGIENAVGAGKSAVLLEFEDALDASEAQRILEKCQGAVGYAA